MADRTTTLEILLECPDCGTRLTPPIFVCETGHGICSECKHKYETCRSCGLNYSLCNQTTIEEIMQEATLSCRYYKEGCQLRLNTDILTYHEKNLCFYRPIICELGKLKSRTGTCQNSITLSEFKSHIKKTHKFSEKENGITIGKTKHLMARISNNMNVLNYFEDSKKKTMFIEKICKDNNNLYINYFYVGHKFERKIFRVTIRVLNSSNNKSFKFVRKCSEFGTDSSHDERKTLIIPASQLSEIYQDEHNHIFYGLTFDCYEKYGSLLSIRQDDSCTLL